VPVDDGLVAVRPDGLSYDAPMHEGHDWVAMLDPVELADGRDPDAGAPTGSPALQVHSVTEVESLGPGLDVRIEAVDEPIADIPFQDRPR
jgi:hypothetical protein